MPVANTTSASFENDVLKADVPVLVDFWAPWCGPCRSLSPVLDALSDAYEGKLKVLKLNIEEHPDVAVKYKIASLPAMKLFKHGDVQTTIVGAKPKHALERELAPHLD